MSLPDQSVAPQIIAVFGQTVFPFAWRCDDPTTVKVWIDDVQDGGFAVNLNADQTASPGGSITRAVGCLGGEVVTVERTSPKVQTTNLVRYGPFPADTITTMLDRAVMLLQEIAVPILQRALRVPRSALIKMSTFDFPLPELGKVPTWVSAGGGLFKLGNVLQAPQGPQGPAGPAGADGATGPAGAGTVLHDVAGKISKMWGLTNENVNAFTGFWANAPTAFGAGSQAIDITTLTRWFLSFTVNSGTPNSFGVWWGGSGGWCKRQGLPKFTARAKFNLITPNIANAFALCSSIGSTNAFGGTTYTPTLGGTNADTSPHVTIAIDSRVNGGKFIFGTADTTTANWIDTGVTCNTVDEFLLCIDLTTAGTAKCTITNCSTGIATTVSLTTHLPAATTLLGPEIIILNNQASVRNNTMLVEYVFMDQAA